jgi:hypothetical protein
MKLGDDCSEARDHASQRDEKHEIASVIHLGGMLD